MNSRAGNLSAIVFAVTALALVFAVPARAVDIIESQEPGGKADLRRCCSGTRRSVTHGTARVRCRQSVDPVGEADQSARKGQGPVSAPWRCAVAAMS